MKKYTVTEKHEFIKRDVILDYNEFGSLVHLFSTRDIQIWINRGWIEEIKEPTEIYSEDEQEELITEIANLREVFDWPKDIIDIKDPLYFSQGEIASSPIGCLRSMISITEYRNKIINNDSYRITDQYRRF